MSTEEKFELDFEKLREDVDLIHLNGELIGYRVQIARLRIAIESIANERDLYAASAITIAAAHKVERDELTAKISAFEYRVDELTHSRDELKPDAERYRWMSAQIVSGDFDLLEKTFGTLDPKAETVTQAEFDGIIDAALKAILK